MKHLIPLCDGPVQLLTSSVAISCCHLLLLMVSGNPQIFLINIAQKYCLCLRCQQKLNGLWKSPGNIATWAHEFILENIL